ncbi:MAG TPA: sensor domain-containing diguanylate cyclase [Actinomycetes bacterium]|nr:sensor domain-containing diguanylate cyclase [Actinomycetes bacterium]
MPETVSQDSKTVAEATRQVAPFALAGVAAPLVAIGSGGLVQNWALLLGVALLLVASLCMILDLARSPRRWVQDTCVFVCLLALTLLVHGAGGTDSGAALVLLVPVVWMALYGSRLDVLVTLALMLTSIVALTLSDGSTDISSTDLRRIVVFVTVPALIVWTVSNLVHRLEASEQEARQGQDVLTTVATAARLIRESSDGRRTTCEALTQVADASSALLYEIDETGLLTVSAVVGSSVLGVGVPLDEPSAAALAFNTGLPVFVANTENDDRVSPGMVRLTSAQSVLVQPFRHGGLVQGVVEVVWRERRQALEPRAAQAVAVLAEEIGSALERADLVDNLQRRVKLDSLTRLPNRRAWREQLPHLMHSSTPLCVAVLDLDLFKTYNDTRGHLAGDRLLQSLAPSWLPLLRPEDLLVRWGGEEFALALPDCALDRAQQVLERLRLAVPHQQTVSAGVAMWDGTESIESLMTRADVALYEAKAQGRNRIVVNAPVVVADV